MTPANRFRLATLSVAMAACYPVAAYSAAGTLQFVIGDVSIRRGSNTITAVKGAAIESGDGLVTGPTGRAQIKFSDGGFIALQPNTKFEVTNYADTGDTKSDRFLVKLAEGGLRAITGAIGHREHDNYKVETPTALIGIRGSSFVAFYDPSDKTLRVADEQDSIQVCTTGGCVGLTSGETALVNPNTATEQPARTNQRPSLPVPAPVQAPQTASNQSTPTGAPQQVVDSTFAPQSAQPPGVVVAEGTHPADTTHPTPAPPAPAPAPTPAPVPTPPPPAPVPVPVPTPPPPAPVPVPTPPPPAPVPVPTPPPPSPAPSPSPSPTTSLSGVTYAVRNSTGTTPFQDSAAASGVTFDSSGNPIGITPASNPPITSLDSTNTPLHTAGTVTGGDYFALGKWTNYKFGVGQAANAPGSTPMAFVVGVPTATTTLNGFNTQRATYSLLNATPVYSDLSTVSPGTVTAATLSVDFYSTVRYGQLSISVDMPAPTSGSTVTGTSTYSLVGTVDSTTGGSFSGTVANTSPVCLTGLSTCTNGTVQGFFNGSGADRVGLTFDASSSAHGHFGGAAALGLDSPTFSTTPSPVDTQTANFYKAYSVTGSAAGAVLEPNNGLTPRSYEQINYHGAEAVQLTDGVSPTQNILQKVGGQDSSFGSINLPNTSNFLGWGYWSQAQYSPSGAPVTNPTDVHYISGLPTATADRPVRGTGSYALVGGTVPTFTYGGGTSPTKGTLNNATLNVSFYTQQVQADVNVTIAGSPYNIHRDLTLNGSSFTGSTQGDDQIAGFIAGDQAQYAGLVYGKDNVTIAALGTGRIAGAAALQATKLVPPTSMLNTNTVMVMGTDAGSTSAMYSGITFSKSQYIVNDTANNKLLEETGLANPNQRAELGSQGVPFPTTTAAKIGTPDTAGFIGWGYWQTGSFNNNGAFTAMQDVHYVVGTPTALANLPTSGSANYSTVVGRTNPTFTTTGTATAVTFGDASVNVSDFSSTANNNVTSTIHVTLGSTPVTITDTVTLGANARFASTSSTAATQISGIFTGNVGGVAGANPANVGLAYSQNITGGNPGRIAGAVVLAP